MLSTTDHLISSVTMRTQTSSTSTDSNWVLTYLGLKSVSRGGNSIFRGWDVLADFTWPLGRATSLLAGFISDALVEFVILQGKIKERKHSHTRFQNQGIRDEIKEQSAKHGRQQLNWIQCPASQEEKRQLYSMDLLCRLQHY